MFPAFILTKRNYTTIWIYKVHHHTLQNREPKYWLLLLISYEITDATFLGAWKKLSLVYVKMFSRFKPSWTYTMKTQQVDHHNKSRFFNPRSP